MKVPFLDLSRQHAPLREEIEKSLRGVLDSGQYILGPETAALEEEIAALCSVPHAVAVASGTDALLLALQAIGVGAGDEVVTTPFTFMATGGAIVRTGARPVFADIDAASFNLDPGKAAAALSARTRAILPVDLYGRCADWPRFETLARDRGLALIEDAAQSIGASLEGRPAGSFGDAAAFSFYPTKNLGGMGDGGMLTTKDEAIAGRVRLLRAHGDAGGYDHREIGMNSRLDAFQAVVLRVKLRSLRSWNEERRRLAARYTRLIEEVFSGGSAAGPGAREGIVTPPAPAPPGSIPVFHQYVVRAPRRSDLMAHLKGRGVGCAVYYPKPLHLQPCFDSLGHRQGEFPETERVAKEVLALPIYPGLREDEQMEVVESIAAFYGAKP